MEQNHSKISTKTDILYYLLKQNRSTAQDLAERFAISPQAVRRHLKDLESENLIQHQVEAIAMGRPQFIYQLSIEGEKWLRHSNESAGYDQFAVSLLDNLIETLGVEQVTQVLHKQWQRKAISLKATMGNGNLEERMVNLVKIRRAEGYVAEWYKADDDGYIFTEYSCAISDVAEFFPSVCNHELEMFATALPDCEIVRTHWRAEGQHRCGYAIKPNNLDRHN